MPNIQIDVTPDALAAALDDEPGDLFLVLAELGSLPPDDRASFVEAFGDAFTGGLADRSVLPFLRSLVLALEQIPEAQ